MTDYQNSTYTTRFDGSLPNTAGTKQGDPFTNSRPQLYDNQEPPQPIAGYADLDPKWVRFEPDPDAEALIFAGVNTRTQMCEITNDGVKEFVGFYQQMPLPTTVGSEVNRAIYARGVANHSGDNIAANTSGNYAGLFIADGDLSTDPETTALTVAGILISRTALNDPPVTLNQVGGVVTLDTFDAVPTVVAEALASGAPYFVRIRTRQRRTGVSTFTSEAVVDFSANGADWTPIFPLATLSSLRKSFGIGLWCNTDFPSTLFTQFVEVVDQNFDDLTSKCGDTLRLGPV